MLSFDGTFVKSESLNGTNINFPSTDHSGGKSLNFQNSMAKNPKAADSRRGRPPTRRPQPRRAKAVPAASSADIEDLAPAVPGAAGAAAAAPAVLRAQLLRWYDAHRRDLPWRRASGGEEERAYAVWVSEVMLQQTRVPVVVGYYERWMARWPTVRSLAAATQEVSNS
jgi:A/G-specific adenine glycosylase